MSRESEDHGAALKAGARRLISPLNPANSLSGRLLLLTVLFVMLSEILIFVPSISRFRLDYLQERLAAAHLATLALEVTPDREVNRDLGYELLHHASAHAIEAYKPAPAGQPTGHDNLVLMLGKELPASADANFDLREETVSRLIAEALAALVERSNRVIQVSGPSPKDPDVLVGVVFDEAPMRLAILDFSWRILLLSLVISGLTAGLVYVTLQWVIVRHLRRIAASVVAFRDNPEDTPETLGRTSRRDEIGVVQSEIVTMQEEVRNALKQRVRLATLGAGMTKIHHDLRNILATASLLSDRLGSSEDPEVRRISPLLLGALKRFEVAPLVREVTSGLSAAEGAIEWRIELPDGFQLCGDREQIFRVFSNLASNAVEAKARSVSITMETTPEGIAIDVTDDGPGLPPKAMQNLFKPFIGSARTGGTGLGLPVVRDIMRAHGGDVLLVSTGSEGTRFRLLFPVEAKRVAAHSRTCSERAEPVRAPQPKKTWLDG